MRLATVAPTALLLALSAALAGCTQGDPGAGVRETGESTSCPSWVKYPHAGQIVDGNIQWTKLSTNPADLQRYDFREPSYNQTNQQWTAGQGFGESLLELDGHPIDQVVFDFHQRKGSPGVPARLLYVQDGVLTVRFFASDGGFQGEELAAWDEARGPASAQHEWTFTSDASLHYSLFNVTLRIDLAPSDADPQPRAVFVAWDFLPDQDADADTPSLAVMKYAPEYWYRTCSKDGTKV